MAKTIVYWGTTGLIAAMFLASGAGYLMHAEQFVEGMTKLGYPLYVLNILGVAKIAAAIVLVVPGLALLKEWAYAGVAIDLLGAFSSHVMNGDAPGDTIAPLIVLVVAAGSYLLRPAGRRLAGTPSWA